MKRSGANNSVEVCGVFSGWCFPRDFVYAFEYIHRIHQKGKKINVFNLKLTRRFTLLVFCFHAAELLFSISPSAAPAAVHRIRVFLVQKMEGRTATGDRWQFWARGSRVFFCDLEHDHKREGLFMSPPPIPHYLYIHINILFHL